MVRELRNNVPAIHVRDHVDLSFCCCDLLLGRELRAATEEERHLGLCVCRVGVCEEWYRREVAGDEGGRARMLCCCFRDGSER
jgi:hypothetical protein